MRQATAAPFFVLLVLVTLLAPTARAKGISEKVTIADPSMQRTVEVTNRADLERLELSRLQETLIAPPKSKLDRDRYHFLSYYYYNTTGGLEVYFTAYYYPDPVGGRGYLLHSNWYQLSAEGEAVLHKLLQHDALPQPGSTLLPQAGSLELDVGLLAWVCFCLMLLAGWLLHYRQARGI